MPLLRRRTDPDRPLSCRQVAKLLQAYLDDAVDQVDAHRVSEHLDECRRCGMEADVYREIKASIARSAPAVDQLAVRRLREFGDRLATGDEHGADDHS